MNCTRCKGTGFLNHDQIPDSILKGRDHESVLYEVQALNDDPDCYCHISPPCSVCTSRLPDVTVCDCCGNGTDSWYGVPGEHYNQDDPRGPNGPYAGNNGVASCN